MEVFKKQKEEESLRPFQVKIAEAARLLRMSPRRLQDYVKRKEIPSAKIGGSRYITLKALEEWVDRMHSYGLPAA